MCRIVVRARSHTTAGAGRHLDSWRSTIDRTLERTTGQAKHAHIIHTRRLEQRNLAIHLRRARAVTIPRQNAHSKPRSHGDITGGAWVKRAQVGLTSCPAQTCKKAFIYAGTDVRKA